MGFSDTEGLDRKAARLAIISGQIYFRRVTIDDACKIKKETKHDCLVSHG